MSAIGIIFDVIQAQDMLTLRECIKANPKVMSEENGEGVPAIHLLMEMGNLELAKYVIEYSIVNPCLLDKRGNTILHYAVKSGNLDLVKYLVERVDMAVDQANLLGVTPYDLSVEQEVSSAPKGDSQKDRDEELSGWSRPATIRAYFEEILGCAADELYHNPIRRGMHPDPSIVRVGEDYYMVNSSFVFFPCIPVSHSKDLIHWEVIGHAITNPEWARLKDLEGGRGYWAPDISYCEGRFYITATYRLNDGGEKLRYQMVTSSDKPEGPYCEPVFLDEDGIDPSIFTDVDGRRYMLLNRGARIFEISPDGREILSEPKLLWYGHNKKASEGPHILHKDGYYYLFMAEGGTGMGHRISVARSKTLMGVYESCPYNPILRQWDEERQLQCCGHGKPVQTAEGDWYMVYLCNRMGTSGYGILGRETAMDPITWTADGWPLVNSLKGPSDLQRRPRIEKNHSVCADIPYDREEQHNHIADGQFEVNNLWSEWSTVRGAKPESYEALGAQVIIHGNGLDLNTLDYGTILLKPQQDFSFEMCCRVKVENAFGQKTQGTCGEKSPCFGQVVDKSQTCECGGVDWDAGLTCYYDENSYLKLALAQCGGKRGILAAEYVDDRYVTDKFIPIEVETDAMTKNTSGEKTICDKDTIMAELRIVTEDLKRSCYYRVVGEKRDEISSAWAYTQAENIGAGWIPVATFEDTSYLSSEGLSKGKRFTGAMAGIYVHGRVTAIFEDFVTAEN